jgi:hypothetical protein
MLESKFIFGMLIIGSWFVCWRWWLRPALLPSIRSFTPSVHLCHLCSLAHRMNLAVSFLADLFIPAKEICRLVLGPGDWWTLCLSTPPILVLLSSLDLESQSPATTPRSNPSPRPFQSLESPLRNPSQGNGYPPLQLLPQDLVALQIIAVKNLKPHGPPT